MSGPPIWVAPAPPYVPDVPRGMTYDHEPGGTRTQDPLPPALVDSIHFESVRLRS